MLEARCENHTSYHTGEDLQDLLQRAWRPSRLSRIIQRWRGQYFTVYLVELEKSGRILNLQIVDTPYLQRFAQTYCSIPIGYLNLEAHHPEDAIFETFYNAHPHV